MSSAARFLLEFEATGDQEVINKIREVGAAGEEASAGLQTLGDTAGDIDSKLSEIASAAGEAATPLTDVGTAATDAATPLTEMGSATEELGGIFTGAGTEAETFSGALTSMNTEAEAASGGLTDANTSLADFGSAAKTSGTSAEGAVGGIKSMSGSIVALGGIIGSTISTIFRMQDAQLALDKANLRASRAVEAARKAEVAFTEVLAKAPSNRENIAAATDTLSAAQEKLNGLIEEGITSGPEYEAAQQGIAEATAALREEFVAGGGDANKFDAALNRVGLTAEAARVATANAARQQRELNQTYIETGFNMAGLVGTGAQLVGSFDKIKLGAASASKALAGLAGTPIAAALGTAGGAALIAYDAFILFAQGVRTAQGFIDAAAGKTESAAKRFEEAWDFARMAKGIGPGIEEISSLLKLLGIEINKVDFKKAADAWAKLFDDMRTRADTFIAVAKTYGPIIWNSIVEGIKSAPGTIWEAITTKVGGIAGAIGQLGAQAWEAIKQGITSASGTIWEAVATKIGGIAGAIGQLGAQAWEAIKSGITSASGTIWEAVATKVGGIAGTIGQMGAQAWEAIKAGITSAGGTIWEAIATKVGGIPGTIGQIGAQIWAAISKGITSGGGTIWEAVAKKIGGIPGAIGQLGSQIWAAIIKGITSASGTIAEQVTKKIGDLGNIGSNIGQQIWTGITNFFSGKTFADLLPKAFASGGGDKSPLATLPIPDASAFAAAFDKIIKAGENAAQLIQSSFQAMTNFLVHSAQTGAAAIGQQFGAIANTAKTMVVPPIKITADVQQAGNAIASIVNTLSSLSPPPIKLTADVQQAGNAIASIVNTLSSLKPAPIKIQAINTQALQQIKATQTALNAIKQTKIPIVRVNPAQALSQIKNVGTQLNAIKQTRIPTVRVNNSQALSAINRVKSALNSLKNITRTITYRYRTVGSPPRGAQSGMHERLAEDTLIAAHKGERVDISPTGGPAIEKPGPTHNIISEYGGGRGGASTNVTLNIPVSLDGKVITRIVRRHLIEDATGGM